ncbi:translesion DNA synthesis-associated protein ImuA [Herbaspirillum sp. LeCh32-8]|uniref:translesion DNA synthesis-associated protein ImuA n=1 Tax=Herbaspirillum sp. LeCh32-8 TaxID=2821356 RepID=UPI001AEA9B86|nr:translesion DNA synthesis-associated protein ImuA [Herbaspirillum sp. LeCh32-8]MBP0597216.1 translesion DNA synthesis-associated protein ImuA [Herbaspirillum sp. LeCh32-8]
MQTPSSPAAAPEAIHPSLWLASQLARGGPRGMASGFAALDAELPEGGWPAGVLIELLLPQDGIGELRLLRPVLSTAPDRRLRPGAGRIALLQAPHAVNAPGWARLGVAPSRLLTLQADTPSDACWAAEQVLRADSCQALLLWQPKMRADNLRRLHMAAQGGSTLFFLFRPLSCAREASPAPLRLALRPARDGLKDGLEIGFIKRRGPRRDLPLFISLTPSPNLQRHVPVDRRTPAAAATGSLSPELAG